MRDTLRPYKPLISAAAAWLLAFALVFGLFYRHARGTARRAAAEAARLHVRAGVGRIEARLGPAAEAAQGLAAALEEPGPGRETMLRLLKAAVERVPGVRSATIAFEPSGSGGLSPRCLKDAGGTRLEWLGSKTHRYARLDWYQVPKELGRGGWNEPTADGDGGLSATYSAPFFKRSGGRPLVAGVVAVEVPLGEIQRDVESVRLLKTGHAVLLSRNGAFIARGDGEPDMAETIFSLAEGLEDKSLRELGRRMSRGEAGRTREVAFAPVPSTGWSMAVVSPRPEVVAGVNRLAWLVVLLGAAGLAVLLAVVASERR